MLTISVLFVVNWIIYGIKTKTVNRRDKCGIIIDGRGLLCGKVKGRCGLILIAKVAGEGVGGGRTGSGLPGPHVQPKPVTRPQAPQLNQE